MHSLMPVRSSLKMTTDSYITIRVSVDICLISSISSTCVKELSKKSIDTIINTLFQD